MVSNKNFEIDSQGFENSYNSSEQYSLEKFFIFTIYQNYTLALKDLPKRCAKMQGLALRVKTGGRMVGCDSCRSAVLSVWNSKTHISLSVGLCLCLSVYRNEVPLFSAE